MKKLLYIVVFVLTAIVVFQQWVISEQSNTIQEYENVMHEQHQHYSKKLSEYDSLMNAYYDSLVTQWDMKYRLN